MTAEKIGKSIAYAFMFGSAWAWGTDRVTWFTAAATMIFGIQLYIVWDKEPQP